MKNDIKPFFFWAKTFKFCVSPTENFKASGENEWYFFTPRDKKYKNGSRPNRAARDGYWRATGADKTIVHNGEKIGYRKSLLYYKGKPMKGDRTSWLMNEYRVVNSPTPVQMTENDMKVCKFITIIYCIYIFFSSTMSFSFFFLIFALIV